MYVLSEKIKNRRFSNEIFNFDSFKIRVYCMGKFSYNFISVSHENNRFIARAKNRQSIASDSSNIEYRVSLTTCVSALLSILKTNSSRN